MIQLKKRWGGDFLGGPVAKNLLCNAADSGSITGQRTKIPHVLGQLNPCTAMKILLLELRPNAAK